MDSWCWSMNDRWLDYYVETHDAQSILLENITLFKKEMNIGLENVACVNRNVTFEGKHSDECKKTIFIGFINKSTSSNYHRYLNVETSCSAPLLLFVWIRSLIELELH